ncbi:hypothetical protein D3C77_356920 [compost metagenome]
MAPHPSIFTLAPRGTAKAAYAWGTPRRSTVWRRVTGRVPNDEEVAKAVCMAAPAPRKKLRAFSPCSFSSPE